MKQSPAYIVPSPLQEIKFPWAVERELTFHVKRDDLIHEAVSGNKWRKLKLNILQSKQLGKTGILTFGGAFSNHLLATAHVCKTEGLKALAIVRGDELNRDSNAVLKQCAEWGMEFRFISREEYHLRDDYEYVNELKDEFSTYYIVPEGGKSFLGIIGCQEIMHEIGEGYDEIWVAQGTCTTSIGLSLGAEGEFLVQAVPVLKNFDTVAEVKKLMSRTGFNAEMTNDVLSRMEVHDTFHFGGYGKTTEELLSFIESIQIQYDIPLDPVYTGKAFYAMVEHYRNSKQTSRRVLFLHTGGLVAGKNLM